MSYFVFQLFLNRGPWTEKGSHLESRRTYKKTGEIVERRWFSALMQTVFSHSESPAKHTFQTRGHPVAWHSRRESTIIFDFRCSSCCAARHGTISNSDKRHAGRNKVTKIKQKCAPPPSQQMNEKKHSFFFFYFFFSRQRGKNETTTYNGQGFALKVHDSPPGQRRCAIDEMMRYELPLFWRDFIGDNVQSLINLSKKKKI